MRAIATDFFARSPAMAGPIVAILLFFLTFVGIVAWLAWSKREGFDALAQLPLDGGEKLVSARKAEEARHG